MDMSYRKLLFTALATCFLASSLVAQDTGSFSSVSKQLFHQNPTLAKDSKINIVELKVAGANEALDGVLAEARYQSADGSIFRTELYFVRKGKLTRIDNGVMAAKLLSGAMLGKDLYYSWSGGSGVHQCYVGRLTLTKGKVVKTDNCVSLKYDLYLRTKKEGVAALRYSGSNNKSPKLVGKVVTKDGKLHVVDEKGESVSL